MKISSKPLWKTLIDKNMSKKDLRLQAHLKSNHIANMDKGEHISMQTLIKICETLNCNIADVITLVPDDNPRGRKGLIMDNGLTYIRVGDYYIPNLALDPEPAQLVGSIGNRSCLPLIPAMKICRLTNWDEYDNMNCV